MLGKGGGMSDRNRPRRSLWMYGLESEEPSYDQRVAAAVVQNVRDQLALFKELGPIVQPAIDDGSVLLVGATYALASGEVTLLD